ncbi:3-isopropylmalate dehydratase small subunit [Microbulbifer hydrolyticus]|uniref:3-isopropylmalate dehydratase small subunit n=1 Tax=Microbulbifer hydrolyticus TaxID=48074 RepID=A0A6P1T970_9GAMM|nr:3-isopropylmalate dehydratase small subunit [Microbulbifer hydrolyticus]MBB5210128.1 3-isopropylmalate/(R)-2-methylmalate dehydratase small subunit [Microbulbifer hydrolyticus]QHQ39354.1 3-isopropylmalate dehydratase small subunit [Microbulbifer hydrolyticus]
MKPFVTHTGIAAPLLRRNIDTDAIIPSREMKRVSKRGLGEGLFAGWRYTLPGSRELNPSFVLNRPEYAGASILLALDNFGCGSSREHAVWALAEYGVRAVIASGFGAIFHTNCIRNGILPVRLDEISITALAEQVQRDPQSNPVTIDLQTCLIQCGDLLWPFSLDESARHQLLNGLDPIALTLQHRRAIDVYEQARRKQRTWVYAPLEDSVEGVPL